MLHIYYAGVIIGLVFVIKSAQSGNIILPWSAGYLYYTSSPFNAVRAVIRQ